MATVTSALRQLRARVFVLAILLLAAGAVNTGLGVVRPLCDVVRARSFVQVPVTWGKAQVLSLHGVMHVTFRYRYVFDGKPYEGTRYAFVHPAAFLPEERLLDLQSSARFPATCAVNPSAPWESVVVRELPLAAYRGSGLAILVCGVLLLLWSRGPLRRFTAQVPLAVLRGAGCLLVLYVAWRAGRFWRDPGRLLNVLLAACLALTLLVARPLALRIVSLGLLCLAFLALCGAALGPLALGELPTDGRHDPGSAIEYLATWMAAAVLLFALAWMARFVAAVRTQPQG